MVCVFLPVYHAGWQ